MLSTRLFLFFFSFLVDISVLAKLSEELRYGKNRTIMKHLFSELAASEREYSVFGCFAVSIVQNFSNDS